MRTEIGQAIDEVRAELAAVTDEILPDLCRLIVGADTYYDVPCRLKSSSGNIDGAPYRIKFGWGTQVVIGAAVVIDAIDGREQLTLQLIEPVDSSTGVFQEWRATGAPAYARADVGFSNA